MKLSSPRLIFLLVSIFTFSALSPAVADEGNISLFPTLRNKPKTLPKELPIDYRLSPFDFTGNVYGAEGSWRSIVTPQKNQAAKIELKTGAWSQYSKKSIQQIWISYDRDWPLQTSKSNKTAFAFTFDDSSIGINLRFCFGGSSKSRLSGKGDQSFELSYGGKECTTMFQGKKSDITLSDPVEEGTKVKLTLSADGIAQLYVNGVMVTQSPEINLQNNFITFVADSSSRRDPKKPRKLVLRDVTVSTE